MLEQISGTIVARWLPGELPKVQNTRLELRGESAEGELLHIELQNTNDSQMALRMPEYLLEIYRRQARFARQILLYVGDAPLSMPQELSAPRLSFAYTAVDIRELDAERLLASPWLSDNVLRSWAACVTGAKPFGAFCRGFRS